MEKNHKNCEENSKAVKNKEDKNDITEAIENDEELAELRKEILKASKKKEKLSINFGSISVTVVLIFLTIISISQAAQSSSVLKKVNSGEIKSSSGSTGTAPLPSSLEDLPDMVGGC